MFATRNLDVAAGRSVYLWCLKPVILIAAILREQRLLALEVGPT